MNLKGKTALVTGGAVRIGKAICEALASQGCHVIIHYGHSQAKAEELKEHLKTYNVEVTLIQADLSDTQQIDRVISHALKQVPAIDILINNAAIFPEPDTFSEINHEQWNMLMDINLRAPTFISKDFSAHIASRNSNGCIINIIDARYQKTGNDHFSYRLGKFALAELTRMLALELAPNIRVNGIAPGAILPPPGKGQDFLERNKRKKVPLSTVGNAHIIAQNVLHLIQQDFVTGQVISVDGGEFI